MALNNRSRSGRAVLAGVVGGALAIALPLGLAPTAARADDMMLSESNVVRNLLPTVVNITAHAEVADTTPSSVNANGTSHASDTSQSFQVQTSYGSGFVIDPSGLIATNWHVINGSYEVFVTFSNGERAKAEIASAARIVDLALLQVHLNHKLTAVTWADSSKVQIGDPVIAIGNPLGVGLSVSGGIVSALNRNIMDTPYDDFIQTDAAINHGNSGGPLFDMKGQVIGVNSALISTTSANAGLGFAFPSNDARFVFNALLHNQWGRPAFLGVKIQAITPEMADALGSPDLHGSIVAWVTAGAPAEQAGIKAGDIIVRFGDQTPTDDRALLRTIAESQPGSKVTLGIIRQGKPMDLPVTLGVWPQMAWESRNAVIRVSAPHFTVPADLGLTVAALTEQERTAHQIAPDAQGALVTGVQQGTDAARRGVTPGDVVIMVGDHAVHDAAEYRQAVDAVRQGGREFGMFLVLPKKKPTSNLQAPGPKWIALRVLSETASK
jgi:serine protease Do